MYYLPQLLAVDPVTMITAETAVNYEWICNSFLLLKSSPPTSPLPVTNVKKEVSHTVILSFIQCHGIVWGNKLNMVSWLCFVSSDLTLKSLGRLHVTSTGTNRAGGSRH